WQALLQMLVQQTPSQHWALAQLPSAPSIGQGDPFGPATHVPIMLQTCALGQSFCGSVLAMMLWHVPVAMPVSAIVQPWHVMLHAVLQQTPSTQLPCTHSLP